jgi:hypothetical protein
MKAAKLAKEALQEFSLRLGSQLCVFALGHFLKIPYFTISSRTKAENAF